MRNEGEFTSFSEWELNAPLELPPAAASSYLKIADKAAPTLIKSPTKREKFIWHYLAWIGLKRQAAQYPTRKTCAMLK